MADFASIIGGNLTDTLPGSSVGANQNAYYRIEAADVFIDRSAASGNSIIALPGQKRKFGWEIRPLWLESGIEQNFVSHWNCGEVRSFLPR